MTRRSNTLDGGTSGVVLSTANSGGASGDAFDLTSGTPTYTNAQSHSPALSVTGTGTLAWSFTGGAYIYWRFYLRLSAYPGSGTELVNVQTLTNTVRGLQVDPTGKLSLRNYLLGTTVATLTSPVVPLNTWVRVESKCGVNTPSPEHEIRLSTNPDSGSYSSAAGTSTQTAQTPISYGVNLVVPSGGALWMDGLAVSDEDWIGPPIVLAPPRTPMPRTAVHRAASW